MKATDAASSLGNAQAIVANVRTAVSTCLQQYTALRDWVTKDNAYQAAVGAGQAGRRNRRTSIPKPGPAAAQGRGGVPVFYGLRHRGQRPDPGPGPGTLVSSITAPSPAVDPTGPLVPGVP